MSETDESNTDRAALQEELAQLQARMEELKIAVTEELIRDWPSPWRNEGMTNAKVTGRLSSNKEYRELLTRQREIEATLGIVAGPRKIEEAEDPMGSYAIKLAKSSKDQQE